MPVVSYCKKCKTEVPVSDVCMSCGKKLPKNSERLSWYNINEPVKDWMSWNSVMRILLPVLFIIFLLVFLVEWLTRGSQGAVHLLSQGLLPTFLLVTTGLSLIIGAILLMQGQESIQYVIDHQGVHTYTFLTKPTKLKWYLRFQRPPIVNGKKDLNACVVEKHVLYKQVRGISLWPDKWKILIYYPKFWLALPLSCAPMNYEEVLAYLFEKLNKKGGIKVHPPAESFI